MFEFLTQPELKYFINPFIFDNDLSPVPKSFSCARVYDYVKVVGCIDASESEFGFIGSCECGYSGRRAFRGTDITKLIGAGYFFSPILSPGRNAPPLPTKSYNRFVGHDRSVTVVPVR